MDHSTVTKFINTFLVSPKGNRVEDVEARFRHWIEVANNPQLFVQDANEFEVAHKRRMARQNLRRLIKKHPVIAMKMHSEYSAKQNEVAA